MKEIFVLFYEIEEAKFIKVMEFLDNLNIDYTIKNPLKDRF